MSARPAPHPSHQSGQEASRRQGLRQRAAEAMAEGSRHQGCRPQQVEPQATFQLRQESLQATTPHRECLLSAQGLPPHRHSLRQAGEKLPRLRLPRCCYRLVDFMSLDPSLTVSRVEVSAWRVWAGATGTSRCASDESDDQAPAQGGDRVRNVTLGSDRWRLWVGNRRESQVARVRAAARGAEGGIVSRSEIRNP